MTSITKLTTIGIPTLVGIGAAWLTTTIIRNEQKLLERKAEMELQLDAKSLTGK